MSKKKHTGNWLVRDPNLYISEPISRNEVLEKIKSGEISLEYELSHSAGYWFKINEFKETLHFFPELANFLALQEKDQTEKIVIEKSSNKGEITKGFEYVVNPGTEQGTTVVRKKDTSPTQQEKKPSKESSTAPQNSPQVLDQKPSPKPLFQNQPVLSEEKKTPFPPKGINKKALLNRIAAAVFICSAAIGLLYLAKETKKKERPTSTKVSKQTILNLKTAILLNDINTAQSTLQQIRAKEKYSSITTIAESLIYNHFLFNALRATKEISTLDTNKIESPQLKKEVENLKGIYLLSTNVKQALASLKNIVIAAPNDPHIQYNYSLALAMNKKNKKAIAVLRKLPPHFKKKDPVLSKVYFLLAQLTKEEKYLKATLQEDPFHGEARILLAIQQWKKKNYIEARKNMNSFIDRLPGFMNDLMIKSYRTEDPPTTYSLARKKIRRLLSNRNASALLLSIDGMLSLMLGEKKEAEQAFKRSLTKSSGNVHAIKGLAYLYFKEGKEVDVEALIQTRIEKNSSSFAFNILLGQSYIKQKKYEKATKLYKKFTTSHSSFSYAWSWLGLSTSQLNKKKSNSHFFKKSLQLNPFDLLAFRAINYIEKKKHLEILSSYKLLPF